MGLVAQCVGVLNALGVRVDTANPLTQAFAPFFLQLGSGLSGSLSDNGSTRTVTVSATPPVFNTARSFSFTNATSSFADAVQVIHTNQTGHQFIEATFFGSTSAAVGVSFQIIDHVSSAVVFGIGPIAWPASNGNLGISFATAANLPAGNHSWTLQAFAASGTLTGLLCTITVRDLASAG